MSKQDNYRAQNDKLNDINFKYRKRIKKLKAKMLYIESIKTIWNYKDKIKDLEHKILINEQEIRYNLCWLAST
tara:strand:+ start:1089 stop:1307 length:219 start_codon:yes stop_codon:yes gene_type:complete